jgi:cob(I)alamin adenosyltransferase
MKIYTKTGDKGISSLYNGIRLTKTSIYFKLLGDLDELNCHIGMAKSYWKEKNDYLLNKCYTSLIDLHLVDDFVSIGNILTKIQCLIMDISSFIATPPWHELKPIKGDIEELIETWINKVSIDFNEIKRTEILIDKYESFLPPIKNFVVPGNDILVSSIHICRSVTRRCERSYIEFLQSDLLCYSVYEHVDCHFNNVQVYLNRLSDFFFVISRFLSFSLNVEEECYSKSKGIL